MKDKATPVLYLDLDGTVRDGSKFVNKVEDVRIFPEALEQMRKAKALGWRIVAISNQGGVAMGHMTFETMQAIMMETQRQCEGMFDKIMACIHFPDAEEPELAICWCRKPRIGLIVEAAIDLGRHFYEYYPPHMALFVGDREEDRGVAEAANIQFLDAEKWRAGAKS